MPLLGDNSYQTVIIDQANVKWIKVMFARSGAVTSITFCPDQPSPAPTPISTGPPSGGKPTPSGVEPTLPPSETCINVEVDFDTDADENPLAPGEYVENEWNKFGLTVVSFWRRRRLAPFVG